MPEEVKKDAVDGKVDNAADQPKDAGDEVLELQAELIKTQADRENYRKGLLKAKGKLTPEELAEEDDRIRSIAREEFLKTKEGDIQQKLKDANERLIKENRELKTANKAKAGTQAQAAGGSQSTEVITNSPLSEEFRAGLVAKGWTPEMIKQLEDKQRERAGKRA